MSKAKGLAWVAATIAVAALSVAGLPRLARHVPWRVERWLGGVAGSPSGAALCTGPRDPRAAGALRALVQRIYPLDAADRQLPIAVDVVPGETVNAFAALGGHIYVFDGLLRQARSPEELAGVLAHEIAHVRNRHIIQGAVVNLFTWGALQAGLPGAGAGSETAYLLLTLKFSRDQEAEADDEGLKRLRRAHVDAGGLSRFFARLEKLPSPPPLLSNHPSNGDRAALAARYTGYDVEPALSPEDWSHLRSLCVR